MKSLSTVEERNDFKSTKKALFVLLKSYLAVKRTKSGGFCSFDLEIGCLGSDFAGYLGVVLCAVGKEDSA